MPLPPNVKKLLEKALNEKNEEAREEPLQEALEAAGFESKDDGLPLPSELTNVQRELAEILAKRDDITRIPYEYLPHTGYWRRRYLGLEKPGALERELKKGVPVWKHLAAFEDNEEDTIQKLKLPLEDRLEIWWSAFRGAYQLDFKYADAIGCKMSEIKGKQPKLLAFAKKALDELAADPKFDRYGPHNYWSWPLFKILWVAKEPLKAEWARFCPTRPAETATAPEYVEERKIFKELIPMFPEAVRAKAIIASLSTFSSERIGTGMRVLEDFPLKEVADLVRAEFPKADGPTRKHEARLKELGFGADAKDAKPKVDLVVTKKRKPKAVTDLTPLEKKQLEAAGKAYDGKKLSAERRLSKDKNDEQSFRQFFEIRDVADKKTKKPAFTIMLYQADSGTVFKAGTTKEVAGIAQDSLECDDAALREALLEVI